MGKKTQSPHISENCRARPRFQGWPVATNNRQGRPGLNESPVSVEALRLTTGPEVAPAKPAHAAGLPTLYKDRISRLLDRLDASLKPEDMNLPGFRFHALKGDRQGEYAVSISANWRLTFRFVAEDASDVNLEDYH